MAGRRPWLRAQLLDRRWWQLIGGGADVAARFDARFRRGRAHRAVQAKGDGYALSRDEELQAVADVAAATGIVLDPV